MIVHLTPVGAATAAGTAYLAFVGRRRLRVRLRLSGLVPGSTHPAHIHFGTCAGGGPIGYPLANVIAGARGVGSSTTVVPGVQAIPPEGWYVNVHQGPTLADGGATPITCGDVRIPRPVLAPGARVLHRPVTAELASQNGSAATGTATLAFCGRDTLAVDVAVHALDPGSVHPEHIHFGTCGAGGPIAYPLQDLVAGPDGTAVATTLVRPIPAIPPEGWYVNVHRGPTLADGGTTPIACGDVQPGGPVLPRGG